MSSTAGLQVRFSLEPRKNPDGQWVNVEYIRIISMTDKYNAPHRPVEPADKVRFASQYDDWKKGLAEPSKGQPLKTWPGITPAEVNVLAQAGLHTVEALAAAEDGVVGQEGPYMALRDAAREYLRLSNSTSAMQTLAAREKEQQAELAALREQLAQAQGRLAQMATQAVGVEPTTDEAGAATPAKRGPGRPPKRKPTNEE